MSRSAVVEGYDEGEGEAEESDSFMFPDASNLVIHSEANMNASEAEWLDSLLESLCDEGETELLVAPADDDDDLTLSPLVSPMSSSDDLPSQHACYSSPIHVPYPVPYSSFHPPLVRPCELDSTTDSPAMLPPAYDALPYYYLADLEESVPDAIEDVSDDESDAHSAPSLCRSSELFFVDPTLRDSRPQHPKPHVYICTRDSYLDRYELDPLPFPDDNFTTYNHVYQEC